MKRMFINLLVYLLISSYQLKSQTLYSVGFGSQYRTGFELFFLIRLDYETNVYKSVGISVNK